jgi:hypothetical protein
VVNNHFVSTARGRTDRAVDADSLFGIPSKKLGGVGNFPSGVDARLTVFTDDEVRQIVGVVKQIFPALSKNF